jgi:transcriptional repressor NrdR
LECPSCQSEKHAVVDSRNVDFQSIRRRRECGRCHHRWTTYEIIREYQRLYVTPEMRATLREATKRICAKVREELKL